MEQHTVTIDKACIYLSGKDLQRQSPPAKLIEKIAVL